MGYEGPYTLGARCASEFVATWMFIFLLESVLANKLLPKTKGHDIGFGWIALGVGLACFLPVQYFGYISSMVNPAMALANCIAEVIDWSDLAPIAACQFAGAFLGGCTVWLFYLPHFATVPEPPPSKIADELLRTRDYINPSSLAYASYSTYTVADVTSLSQGLQQFSKVMKGNSRFRAYKDEDLLGRHSLVGRSGVTRRRSVNESDLHGRIHRHRQDHGKKPAAGSSSRQFKRGNTTPRTSLDQQRPLQVNWPLSSEEEEDVRQPLLHHGTGSSPSLRDTMGQQETTITICDAEPMKKKAVSMRSLQALANHDTQSGLFYEPGSDPGSDFLDSGGSGDDRWPSRIKIRNGGAAASAFAAPPPRIENAAPEKKEESLDGKKTKSQRLHEASVKADQNAKLAVFATRPAMFVPICNLINEIISAMLLTSGILMLNQRGAMIWEGDKEVYMHGLKSFWVGILVVVLVLCLGGPGIAMNPARDLGPRVAHWVLPIAGKGPSEWYYGWICVVGPFIGGALGGVFYNLCDLLNESTVHRGYYTNSLDDLTNNISNLTTLAPTQIEL